MLFFFFILILKLLFFSQLHPFRVKLEPNYFKLLSDNKIERKRVEVRKIEEMDDNIRNNMASLFIIQPLTIIKKKTTKKLK